MNTSINVVSDLDTLSSPMLRMPPKLTLQNKVLILMVVVSILISRPPAALVTKRIEFNLEQRHLGINPVTRQTLSGLATSASKLIKTSFPRRSKIMAPFWASDYLQTAKRER
jgi:hypothetical protein